MRFAVHHAQKTIAKLPSSLTHDPPKNTFSKIFRNITQFFKQDSVILGRWNHKVEDNKKEERAIRASSDHCGDYICGNPNKIKEIIKKNR